MPIEFLDEVESTGTPTVPTKGKVEFLEPPKSTVQFLDETSGPSVQFMDEPEPSSYGEQIKDIPRGLMYGAADAFVGASEGAARGIGNISRKLAEHNEKNYNEIINTGGEADGWRAKAFDTLGKFHRNMEYYWTEYEGTTGLNPEKSQEIRDKMRESFAPESSGFVTDVARGVGGMATLPIDLSYAGLLSIPGQMFDEGYQQSTGTEEERLDKATAYAFMGSPVELLGDIMLKKFGGRGTKKGITAIAKQALKKLGLNFVSEGSTETLQDGILNVINGNRAFDENSLRTFLVSGTVGSIVSGAHIVGNEVKSSRTRGQLETMGLNEADVSRTMELIATGKVDEATAFINEKKNLKLTDIIEASQQASAENAPLDEKQASQLETLAGKDDLSNNDEAELAGLQMALDADDQAIVDDYLNKVEGSDVVFNDLINRLKGEQQQQEAQDVTERSETTRPEQAKVTGQESIDTPDADGGPAQAEPAQAEEGVATEQQIAESDTVGFSTAALNTALTESGREPLNEVETKAHQESMDNAINKGLNATADDLAARVLQSKNRKGGKTIQMSDEEVAGMGARTAELRNERSKLFLAQKKAMEAGDQQLVDELQIEIEQNLDKAETIALALKTSATASGRANSMMASIINRFSYDVIGLTDAGRNAKGAPLTQEESASLVDTAEQIAKAEEEVANKKDEAKVLSQLERLSKRLIELQKQYKGQYRNIPETKEAKVVSDEIQAIKDEIADVSAIMRTEDKYADLLERIRERKSLVPTKKERRKESKELVDAKVKLARLRKDAREKVYALHNKTLHEKLRDWITLPRAALATGDLSGALRQGFLGLFMNPKQWAKSFGKGLNATFSQYNADAQDVALREQPDFEQINDLVTIANMDSAIKGREEMFSSHLIEKIPVLGVIARASERNMVTLLNELRFGIMRDYMARNPKASQKALERMGKLVDASTGRGRGRLLDVAAPELSVLAFAPRFAYSRVQAPVLAAKYMADPELRGEIIKQWGSMLVTGMTILALAKVAGAEVGDDPEDSDFGKIIIDGNKHIDIWGGLQQPMRVLLKAIKGGVENVTEGETDVNPIADIGNYLKYKMSPPFMMMNELISGKDIIGRETGTLEIGDFESPRAATVFAKNMFPIVLQSAVDSVIEGESATSTAALMAGEGLGLSIGVYDK